MIAIAIKDLEKYYGATKVLNNISMEINEGEKTAIIGTNGCGKTTLFKVITGLERHEGGMLALKKNIRIGYLEQLAKGYPEMTVYDVMLSGLKELMQIKQQMEQLETHMAAELEKHKLDTLMKRYGLLIELYEAGDGYSIDARVKKISEGLSIGEKLFDRQFDQLSGGEKTRILFAKMLIAKPELLLMDEPTNHLDIEAVEWLEGFIKEYDGTVLIISHDRYFLDKAVNRIIEIGSGGCESYNGNYTYYVQEKDRRLLAEFENYQDQQKRIKHMEEAIKRFRDWGARGDNEKFFKKAASIQKALDRMEKLKKPVLERRKVELNFSPAERGSKEAIYCEALCKAYGDKVIFDKADILVRFKEKLGILGANGTGKSTLFKLILEQELPDKGIIKVGQSVKIGYLAQSVQFEDESLTILEEFRNRLYISEGEARSTLARFLFFKEAVFKKLKDLSGGEKTRLRLAELIYEDVNLLMLDEPTNHLDIDTREALEETLENYEGTIVFVSHDRYFINKLADSLYNIEDCRLVSYCGNYDYFREKHSKPEKALQQKPTKEVKQFIKSEPLKKDPIEKEKLKLEQGIEQLELKLNDIRAQLDDPINSSDFAFLCKLNERIKELELELNIRYESWLRLSR